MIDMILIFILAFLLYRAAVKHGLSPLSYVLNYISASILVWVISFFAFVHLYGISTLQIQPTASSKITDPNILPLLLFEIISLTAEVTLFFYLKWRIQHVQLQPADEDDRPQDNHPTPPKKDLSYFR